MEDAGASAVVLHSFFEWLEVKEYDSIAQLQGSMSQINCPDPSVFERVQYLKAVQTFPTLISSK